MKAPSERAPRGKYAGGVLEIFLSHMHKMERTAYNIADKKFASYLLYRRKVRNRNFCYGDFRSKTADGILAFQKESPASNAQSAKRWETKKVPASSIASI